MSLHVGARTGDAIPTPADFAGWPPLGAEAAMLRVGPTVIAFEGMDEAGCRSLERWAGPDVARAHGRSAPADMVLELLQSPVREFLATAPGERARVLTGRDGRSCSMTAQHAALLFDPESSRGLVLLADVRDEAVLDRALQNLLRVAVAWHVALTGRGLLVHASTVAVDDEAAVFVGPSGAGKSTIVALSSPRTVLADDLTVLEAGSAGTPWRAHPSPLWAEPTRRRPAAEAGALPAGAFLQLAHGTASSLSPLPRATAAALVAAHAPFLSGLGFEDAVLALAADAVRDVPAARLTFGLDPSFWDVLGPFLRSRTRSFPSGAPR